MHAVDPSSRCTTIVYRVVLRRAPAADWLSIFLIEGNPFHLEIQTRPQSRTLLDVRAGGGKRWSVGHGGDDDVTLNGFAVGRKRLSIPGGCIGGRNMQ